MNSLDEMFSGETPEAEKPTEAAAVAEPTEAQPAPEDAPQQQEAAEDVTPTEAEGGEGEKPAPHMVPVDVVAELRAQIRDLKAQQPKPEPRQETPPDIFEAPDQVLPYVQRQIDQRVQNAVLNMSEASARRQHGNEAVDAALAEFKQAIETDPSVYARVMNSPDPYDQLLSWKKEAEIVRDVAQNPEAYRARVEAEVRAKLEAEMKEKLAAETKRAAITPTPSLAGGSNMGGSDPGGGGEALSLDDLLNS